LCLKASSCTVRLLLEWLCYRPPDIWFDDVDEILLDLPKSSSSSGDSLVKANSFEGLVQFITNFVCSSDIGLEIDYLVV
jgi:hypothetical protein